MARREALIVEANGERFRFYYDRDIPEVLHITLRHAVTIEDAVLTFFEGSTRWEAEHLRFRSETGRHVLLWARHTYDASVMIISCFRQGDS